MEYTDRTRCETWTDCHRKRWWGTEWGRGAYPSIEAAREGLVHIGGIQPEIPGIETEIGSAVHEAAAHLWEMVGRRDLDDGDVRTAVALALDSFHTEISKGVRFPESLTPEARAFKLREAEAMVEGWVWVMGLRVIPALLERFEVVEVEREGAVQLTPDIQFLYRPDALLRERESGDLYIWSLKVIKEVWEQDYKRDVQGMSECWARSRDLQGGETVMGVVMTYLIKGRMYENEGIGCKVHSCPLTRAWRMDDGLSVEWAWSYEVPRTSKAGESYVGRLGKGWVQTPAWEYPGGMEAWVRALLAGEVQAEAGDPVAKLVLIPESYWRNDLEIRDWVEEIQQSETDVVDFSTRANALMRLEDVRAMESVLNARFPKNRKCCMKFGASYPCIYMEVCWGKGGEDPLGAGFRLRAANHPKEECG